MERAQPHKCPKCGYEYEAWVEACPDCGVPIETVERQPQVEVHEQTQARRGALDPGDEPRWTVVTNLPNAIIGNLIKDQLEDAGIPVLMQRAPSADIAQFSYNDYVPQDLRVPYDRLEDARRILDSRPDKSVGAPYWESGFEEFEPEEGNESKPYDLFDNDRDTVNPGSNGLPEGWSMLPSEGNIRAREGYQRRRSGEQSGDSEAWYRSDAARAGGVRDVNLGVGQYEFNEEPLEVDKERFSRPIEREDWGGYRDDRDDWSGPSKWTRLIYGILLLVLSLPFIFQILQQIASAFKFSH